MKSIVVSGHFKIILNFRTSASNMILSLPKKQLRKDHTDRELAKVLI